MASICAGCLQKLPKREFLTCSICKSSYDLDCANVPIGRFNNTTRAEHKRTWKCQTCRCAMPKSDNTNTPVRNMYNVNEITKSPKEAEQSNITLRGKPSSSINVTLPIFEDDDSVIGNTILNSDTENVAKCQIDSVILTQLEELLEKKLEKNKKSLLTELKTMIIDEITNRVTNEISLNMNIISTEQQSLKKEIDTINTYIKNLQYENSKLKSDIEKLQKGILPETIKKDDFIKNFENNKKFVLYGLNESDWETENELHDRVMYIFQDLLNINLEGYIENINRIGKKGYRRPLKIELLSKKMVKIILESKLCFRGTGLAITEYLDENSRQTRKKLINIMKDSRRNGHHAVLRNNKLIINGTDYEFPEEPYTQRETITRAQIREQSTEQSSKKHNNRNSQCINYIDDTFRAH